MRLTDDEREGHECCLRKSSCRADHYHSEDVEAILTARLARVEALADEFQADFDAYRLNDPVYLRLRAALAAPSPEVQEDAPTSPAQRYRDTLRDLRPSPDVLKVLDEMDNEDAP